MTRLLRAVMLGLVLGLAACNGCGGCGGCGQEKDADAGVVVAPVPAPDKLLADAYVMSPDRSWSKLQRGVGGAVGILPATLPHIVAMTADLDPRIATELDGTAPMFAAAAGDPLDPAFCIAIRFVDPRRARMLLTEGEAALFTARDDGTVTHLVPKRPPPEGPKRAVAALTSNGFVVIGRSPESLTQLAPYTTRTLPSRPIPTEGSVVVDIPRSSVANLLAPKLEAAWASAKDFLVTEDDRMRGERGGRAPDFGDPKAIVAALDAVIGRRIAVFRDVERARLAFDVQDDAVTMTATLTPVTGDSAAKRWVDGMKVGDAAAVLGMPSSSVLALSMRDTEDDRAAQAAEIEKAVVSSLGERLDEKDAKRVHDVLSDWTSGRDETLAVAYAGGAPPGALVTTRARNADAAGRAVRSALDLAQASPFKELLRVKDITTSTEEVAGLGKAQVAKIVRDAPRPAPRPGARDRDGGTGKAPRTLPPATTGVAWSTEGGTVAVAVGDEPLATLRTGIQPEKKLRDDRIVARFAERIGETASIIAIGQPLRIDPRRIDAPAAPVAIALTRSGGDAVLRVDVADVLLRELSRTLLGF